MPRLSDYPLDENLTPAMASAIEHLFRTGVYFHRKTQFHLKVGCINYYPNKGTITLDGGPTLTRRGLQIFLYLVAAYEASASEERVFAVVRKNNWA